MYSIGGGAVYSIGGGLYEEPIEVPLTGPILVPWNIPLLSILELSNLVSTFLEFSIESFSRVLFILVSTLRADACPHPELSKVFSTRLETPSTTLDPPSITLDPPSTTLDLPSTTLGPALQAAPLPISAVFQASPLYCLFRDLGISDEAGVGFLGGEGARAVKGGVAAI